MKLLEVVHLPVGERMAFISHERLIRTQRKEREKVRTFLDIFTTHDFNNLAIVFIPLSVTPVDMNQAW